MWSRTCKQKLLTQGFTSSKKTFLGQVKLRCEQQHRRMFMLRCIGSSNNGINSRNNRFNFLKEVFTLMENIMSMLVNSGESCKKLNIKRCWTLSLAQPLGELSKGRELSIRGIWQSKLRDGEHILWKSMMREERLCQCKDSDQEYGSE